MSEATVPHTEDDPDFLVGEESEPIDEVVESLDDTMHLNARRFISKSLGMPPQSLRWMERKDAGAMVCLYDTLSSRFFKTNQLSEGVFYRLGLLLSDGKTPKEISDLSYLRTGMLLPTKKVVEEQDGLIWRTQMVRDAPDAKSFISDALDMLREEKQAEKDNFSGESDSAFREVIRVLSPFQMRNLFSRMTPDNPVLAEALRVHFLDMTNETTEKQKQMLTLPLRQLREHLSLYVRAADRGPIDRPNHPDAITLFSRLVGKPADDIVPIDRATLERHMWRKSGKWHTEQNDEALGSVLAWMFVSNHSTESSGRRAG